MVNFIHTAIGKRIVYAFKILLPFGLSMCYRVFQELCFIFIIFFPKLPFLVSTGRLLTPIRENTQPFWNTLCRDEKKSKTLLFVTVVCIMSMLRLLFWCSTISIWMTISLCCQLVWELRGHGDWKDRYR